MTTEERGQIAAMREALEEAEYGGCWEEESQPCCPVCEVSVHDKHKADCLLGRALASGAGKREAEVIEAASALRTYMHLYNTVEDQGTGESGDAWCHVLEAIDDTIKAVKRMEEGTK